LLFSALVALLLGAPSLPTLEGRNRNMHDTPRLPTARWAVFVAVLLAVVFIALCGWALHTFLTIDRGMVIYRLDAESSRLASNLFFEKMTALAQLAVALLGGTWAFITLAETTVRIRGWPTITCFSLANLSLASSLLVYVYGYDFLVGRIFYHATFDIDAPIVASVQSAQQYFFLKGVVDLGATILIGRRTS